MNTILPKRLEIFRYRSYTLYFVGTIISMIGSGMQFIATTWLVSTMTGTNLSVALVLICSTIPGIVLAPIIGVYVDRLNRKYLAAAMDVARALVLIGVINLWWLGLLQPWHIYLMAFLIAVGDQIYTPTVLTLIREVVPREMLLTANSTTSIADQIGGVLGAGIAGVIIMFFSPITVMAINAASFCFSAFCIMSMQKGSTIVPRAPEGVTAWRRFLRETREGVAYIKQHHALIYIYGLMLFILSTLRVMNVLLVPFTKDVLEVGAIGFGYIDAAFALGAIIGNLVLPSITRIYGASKIMVFGVIALAINLLFFSLSQNLPMAIIGYLLIGIVFPVRILYLTKAQEQTDILYQGRVHTTFNAILSAGSLGIYLLMGFLADLISVRWIYGFQGILLVIAGGIAYRMMYQWEEDPSYAIV